jgi:hypothetical protein
VIDIGYMAWRGWPDNSLADLGFRILQTVEGMLCLQGATVYAIARKRS